MISIAIVDDDILECATIEDYLNTKLTFNQKNISDFSNGKDLIDALESGQFFDIIFLDIYMQPIDGYETGVYIRKRFPDKNIIIIYISTRTENLIPFFSLHPFDYLEKPISYDAFSSLMDNVLDSMKRNDSITIKTKSKELIIYINDIIYASTHEGHKVKITMINHPEIDYYGKLSDLFALASEVSNSIIQIHKSFIINLQYIKSISRTEVELYNTEEKLPISQKYQKQISELYYNYKQSQRKKERM